MSEALTCAHCGGPHPDREDPDHALCSALCVVESGGYMEGCDTAAVVSMYVEDVETRVEALGADADEDAAWALAIARLLKWLVRVPTIEQAPRINPLAAALDAFLEGDGAGPSRVSGLIAALTAVSAIRPTNWADDEDAEQVAAWRGVDAALLEGSPQ